jgi:hypothetical protein
MNRAVAVGIATIGLLVLLIAAWSQGPASPPAIAAVSASHPSADAAAALDACTIVILDPARGTGFGIGVVDRMGLVAPGRDVPRYVPVGNAPEVKTDAPLWVIVTNDRWLSFPLAPGSIRNATCIWRDQRGDPLWFATGDRMIEGGRIETPFPDEQPTLTLPTLAP